MAISFIRQTASYATGGNTVSTSLSNTAGNAIIVAASQISNSPTFDVSDTNGNSYAFTSIMSFGNTFSLAIWVWTATNVAGGANTVTVTSDFGADMRLCVLEYAGLAATDPKDVTAADGNITGTVMATGASPDTAEAYELVLSFFGSQNGGIATPSGYTARSGPDTSLRVAEKIVSAVGPQSATATTNNGGWAALLTSFRSDGSGAGVTPTATDDGFFAFF